MAYSSIFSGGKITVPTQAAAIGNDFQPGQYAKINAQIAQANHPTQQQQVKTLGAQLKAGQIDMPAYITKFNKITGVKQSNPYTPGNFADAFKNAVNQVIVQPGVGLVKGIAQQAGQAGAELSATPLNIYTPKPQDVIEQTTRQIQTQLLKNGVKPDVATAITNAVRAKGYKQFLQDAGIGINDSPATIGRKAIGNIGGTATNVLPVGESLKSASLIGRMLKSAFFGGVAGGIGNLANDQLTPQSEGTAIAGGAVAGGFLPPVIEGASSLLGKALGKAGSIPRPRSALDNLVNENTDTSGTSTKPTEAPAAAPKTTPTPPQVKSTVSKDLVESGTVKPTVKTVPASSLKLGSDTLGSSVDKGTVAQYVSDIKAGKNIDPVVVSEKDGQLYVQDGKHRLEAMKQAGVTDIPTVEKATKSASTTPTTEKGTSKIGTSIQEKAVQRGLKDTFGDSAQYEKINLADQAKKAVAVTNDRQLLDQIISGDKPLPNGLRATALIKAVEEHPELGKDPELLNRLSQSEHLVGESSRSAQELRLAAERNPDSPITRLQEVRQAREAAAEKNLKTPIDQAVKATTKEVKSSVPKVTRQDWHSFIESIKC